ASSRASPSRGRKTTRAWRRTTGRSARKPPGGSGCPLGGRAGDRATGIGCSPAARGRPPAGGGRAGQHNRPRTARGLRAGGRVPPPPRSSPRQNKPRPRVPQGGDARPGLAGGRAGGAKALAPVYNTIDLIIILIRRARSDGRGASVSLASFLLGSPPGTSVSTCRRAFTFARVNDTATVRPRPAPPARTPSPALPPSRPSRPSAR